MVTSSAMPSLVVEIAFNAGFNTPAASRTWTDISDYVELQRGVGITFGRQDERSVAGPNKVTLTLNNSDGRFTPTRTASPYYPNVKLDRPLRVTATPVGGTPSVRFLGYVTEWPVAWDKGTDATSTVTVTATSRLARLGLDAGLRSVVEEEILVDSPLLYYPLSEPAGSTSGSDASGNLGLPVQAVDNDLPVDFGNGIGPGTDELPAAQFPGTGASLRYPGETIAAPWTIEFFFSAAASAELFSIDDGTGLNYARAEIVSGILRVERRTPTTGADLASSGIAATDGEIRHVALTMTSGGQLDLFVNGVFSATAGTAPPIGVGPFQLGAGLDGSMAHVAVFGAVVPTPRLLAHATAGLTGFAEERTDVRLARYSTYADVEPATLDLEAGTTTVIHVPTTGKKVVDMLRVVESTEGGVLFDDRDGDLVLHSRSHRYATTPAFTLDMAEQHIESDFAPRYDRSSLLTDMSVANLDGTVTARYAVSSEYGPAAESVTTASDEVDEPSLIAAWLVNAYKEPRLRVPSVTVDLLAQVGKTPSIQTLYAATIGTLVRVANQPTQADAAVRDYFVEGATESYNLESASISFNVSPSSPYDQVLIWDDPTRGVWDSYTWAY